MTTLKNRPEKKRESDHCRVNKLVVQEKKIHALGICIIQTLQSCTTETKKVTHEPKKTATSPPHHNPMPWDNPSVYTPSPAKLNGKKLLCKGKKTPPMQCISTLPLPSSVHIHTDTQIYYSSPYSVTPVTSSTSVPSSRPSISSSSSSISTFLLMLSTTLQ